MAFLEKNINDSFKLSEVEVLKKETPRAQKYGRIRNSYRSLRARTKQKAKKTESEIKEETPSKEIFRGSKRRSLNSFLKYRNKVKHLEETAKDDVNNKQRRTTRTSTQKNYSKSARARIKQLNRRIKGGFQHEGDTTKEDRTRRRRAVHRQISSVKKIRSNTKASEKTSYAKEAEKRRVRSTGTRRWKNYYTSLKQKELRQARKKRIYKGPSLQRTWKGDRLEGDLSGFPIE
jgi:hypothetical protein